MRNKKIFSSVILIVLLLSANQPVWAAGPPAPSIFSSALALSLLLLMGVLLIVIGILANMLISAADIKLKKRKEEKQNAGVTMVMLPIFLLLSSSLFAQGGVNPPAPAVSTIGDLASGTFYLMVGIIFVELLVVFVLLLNIRALLMAEKARVIPISEEQKVALKKNTLSWWDRFNSLRPVSQESELDLGHDYDGIRELNNRLPPWWLYGFYLTIVFAVFYLWRFHVSHNGPSSAEEYEASVAKAEVQIANYLKAKGEAVDENTVTLLSGSEDLAAGKEIFLKSCAACHKPTGGGDVGPNLTDDFWLHGNDIKSVFKTIRYGFNAMPQWQMAYSNKQIAQVASYVKSLHGSNPPNPKAPQGVEMKEGNTNTSISDSTKKVTTPTADSTKK